MTRVWRPLFPIGCFWGSDDAMAQGFWGPASLGKSGVHASHGARLSSVPLGDRSANPASVPGRSGLQRALLSVSSAHKCSRAGRLDTPSGFPRAARLAISCQPSASGHPASRSKYTRGQSRETGSLSRSTGGVEAPAKRVSLGPAWVDSGSISLPRRWRGSDDRCFQ